MSAMRRRILGWVAAAGAGLVVSGSAGALLEGSVFHLRDGQSAKLAGTSIECDAYQETSHGPALTFNCSPYADGKYEISVSREGVDVARVVHLSDAWDSKEVDWFGNLNVTRSGAGNAVFHVGVNQDVQLQGTHVVCHAVKDPQTFGCGLLGNDLKLDTRRYELIVGTDGLAVARVGVKPRFYRFWKNP